MMLARLMDLERMRRTVQTEARDAGVLHLDRLYLEGDEGGWGEGLEK